MLKIKLKSALPPGKYFAASYGKAYSKNPIYIPYSVSFMYMLVLQFVCLKTAAYNLS